MSPVGHLYSTVYCQDKEKGVFGIYQKAELLTDNGQVKRVPWGEIKSALALSSC